MTKFINNVEPHRRQTIRSAKEGTAIFNKQQEFLRTLVEKAMPYKYLLQLASDKDVGDMHEKLKLVYAKTLEDVTLFNPEDVNATIRILQANMMMLHSVSDEEENYKIISTANYDVIQEFFDLFNVKPKQLMWCDMDYVFHRNQFYDEVARHNNDGTLLGLQILRVYNERELDDGKRTVDLEVWVDSHCLMIGLMPNMKVSGGL